MVWSLVMVTYCQNASCADNASPNIVHETVDLFSYTTSMSEFARDRYTKYSQLPNYFTYS